MKVIHARTGKEVRVNDALTFLADERGITTEAYPGDVIGLHNHGTISIADTFSEGESLHFVGIPNFAPELFRRVRLRDPLRMKQLHKGLSQLSEEGATQFFKPLLSSDLVLGAVGTLQFEVVAYRLKDEYGVDALFEPVQIASARWVSGADPSLLADFTEKSAQNLAMDATGSLVYLAPTRVNLQMTQERWPALTFAATREYVGSAAAQNTSPFRRIVA